MEITDGYPNRWVEGENTRAGSSDDKKTHLHSRDSTTMDGTGEWDWSSRNGGAPSPDPVTAPPVHRVGPLRNGPGNMPTRIGFSAEVKAPREFGLVSPW